MSKGSAGQAGAMLGSRHQQIGYIRLPQDESDRWLLSESYMMVLIQMQMDLKTIGSIGSRHQQIGYIRLPQDESDRLLSSESLKDFLQKQSTWLKHKAPWHL